MSAVTATPEVSPVLRLHPNDDVVIARRQLVSGTPLPGGVTVIGLVPPGHKVAARAIRAGAAARLGIDHRQCVAHEAVAPGVDGAFAGQQRRRQRVDEVAPDVQVHAQTGDAHRQPVQLVVGLLDAEVALQCGDERRVHRRDVAPQLLVPQPGGLEHLAKAQLHAQPRRVAVAQRREQVGEERRQRLLERQRSAVLPRRHALAPAQRLEEGRAVQAGLVAEVVADRRDVDARRLGELAGRRLREALLREQAQAGAQQALACGVALAAGVRVRRCVGGVGRRCGHHAGIVALNQTFDSDGTKAAFHPRDIPRAGSGRARARTPLKPPAAAARNGRPARAVRLRSTACRGSGRRRVGPPRHGAFARCAK